ncbi:MAG: hypothetical protein V3V39_11585 [Desulfobacterales bacterium]|jgi:hypothetical protein
MITVEDGMRAKKKALRASKLLMFFVLINLCIACAGSNPLSPGAWVPEEDRISVMDGGPHKGSWQTRDLSIHYEYQEAAPGLQVKGVIELANYILMGYNALEYFYLNIHLLEPNGVVLSTQRIRSSGYLQPFRLAREMTFNGSFDLTQDTVAFAFSYSGRAVSADGPGPASSSGTEGRIDWEFWKVPHRSPPK